MNWIKSGRTDLISWRLFSWLSLSNLWISRVSLLRSKFPLHALHQPLLTKTPNPFFNLCLSGRTGTDSSVSLHQSASQPGSETTTTSSKRTGKDTSASQHLSPSQLVTDQKSARPSSPGRTSKDSASEHRPASQPSSDRHRPVSHTGTDPSFRHSTDSKVRSDRPRSTLATDSGSPSLHRQRRDSSSSGSSASASDYSDRPPVDLYAEEVNYQRTRTA